VTAISHARYSARLCMECVPQPRLRRLQSAAMRDHTSLKAWQEAHAVVHAALDLAASHWRPSLAAVYAQLTSAAVSVQINIAEGYALGTPALFARHLRIAYGSAVEAGELLEILGKRCAVPPDRLSETIGCCRASQRLLLGLIRKYRTPAPS